MSGRSAWLSGVLFVSFGFSAEAATLVEEHFEDTNFTARGWYDGAGFALSSTEHIPGSTKSAEFRWRRGGTNPAPGASMRRRFTPSEEVFLSYWVKYSSNYTGSNKPYHPHEFLLLTTENGAFDGPAFTHLTGYVEQNEGTPLLSLQDGQNIDQTKIGQDLRTLTENRSVAGCNGTESDGATHVDCYRNGTSYWNGKTWKAGQAYFQDARGRFYKGDWHYVEANFKLNRIADGKAIADGQLRYWYDGKLIIESTNVIMRTGSHPTMKWNQLLIAPYIGDGSPEDQVMWLDDLRITATRLVADADADGMLDDWERAYALDPADPADKTADVDGDRLTNLHEYLAGTDPRNAQSVLRIDGITRENDRCAVRFRTVSGKLYSVESTDDPSSGAWSETAKDIVGTGEPVQVTDIEPAPERRFYRLKL